jgi:hypothetical protein
MPTELNIPELLDGCRGTSEDDEFNEFVSRLLKKLDRSIDRYYLKKRLTERTIIKP